MKNLNIPRLLISIIVCELAGIVGSIFTIQSIPTWYATLTKPSFNPPNWVFGPVWTALYLLMGISLYLVWSQKTKKKSEKGIGLYFFFVQLILNALWSIVFFGAHSLYGGFIIIIVLWTSILLTINYFQKVNKLAAYLLYPYLVWVSFASILNLSIALLNK